MTRPLRPWPKREAERQRTVKPKTKMTQTEHRLVKLAEECVEVAQRCTKAIRFGLSEVQKDQPLNNNQRIRLEMAGLWAAYSELVDHDGLRWPNGIQVDEAREKQEKYRRHSETLGTLKPMAKKKKLKGGRGGY